MECEGVRTGKEESDSGHFFRHTRLWSLLTQNTLLYIHWHSLFSCLVDHEISPFSILCSTSRTENRFHFILMSNFLFRIPFWKVPHFLKCFRKLITTNLPDFSLAIKSLYFNNLIFLRIIIHWSIDSLIHWLIHPLIDWLTNWFIDLSIYLFIYPLIDWLVHRSIDWLIGWLIDFVMNL